MSQCCRQRLWPDGNPSVGQPQSPRSAPTAQQHAPGVLRRRAHHPQLPRHSARGVSERHARGGADSRSVPGGTVRRATEKPHCCSHHVNNVVCVYVQRQDCCHCVRYLVSDRDLSYTVTHSHTHTVLLSVVMRLAWHTWLNFASSSQAANELSSSPVWPSWINSTSSEVVLLLNFRVHLFDLDEQILQVVKTGASKVLSSSVWLAWRHFFEWWSQDAFEFFSSS